MQFTRSAKGALSIERNEGGTVRWYLAPTTASAPELAVRPVNECGGRERAHTRVQERRSKPRSSRVPGRHSLVADAGVPVRTKWWVKNCDPTRVAVEQASNIARGTPDNPAESRFTTTMFRCREASEHAGPVRLGGQRGPAFRAPPLGDRRLKPRAHPAPTQEQGVRSYAPIVVPAKARTQ
jgi:hypothetical protein